MRIHELHVHGFGRLVDRGFTFGQRLTIVHGPNEAGKSTLHAALRASMFGLVPGGRRTPATTAEIERWSPWAAGRYATRASLTRRDGDRIRIDWDFARSSFTVTDAATGADLTSEHGAGSNPAVLCETLYGVTRDAYLRVGCVGQSELARIDDASGVRGAVERVAGQAASDTGVQAALTEIRSFRSREVGLNKARSNALPQAEEEAERLHEALAAAAGERTEAERLAAERDSAEQLVYQLTGSVTGLEIAIQAAQARELRQTVERAESADDRRRSATAVLEVRADAASFAPISGVAGARERVAHVAPQVGAAAAQRSAARRRLEALQADHGPEAGAVEPSALSTTRLGLVAAAAAIGVAAGIILHLAILAIAAAALGIAAALATVTASRARAARAGDGRLRAAADRRIRIAEAEAELAPLEARAAELDDAHRHLASLLDVADDEVAVAQALQEYDRRACAHAEWVEAERERTLAEAELRQLLGDRGLDRQRALLLEAETQLNGHRDAPGADRDTAQLAAELHELSVRHQQAQLEAGRLAATVTERLRLVPDVVELRERLDDARERVERLRRIDGVLKLAESELAAAASDTYRDFAPRLNDALCEGLARVTGGRYSTAYVDEDLSVRLEAPETGAVVDLDRLSVGTQRLAYLVQRLELVRLIAPSVEPLPVLLDDPFAHLDAARVRAAVEVLYDASGERQLIVFTTQKQVLEMAPAGTMLIDLA